MDSTLLLMLLVRAQTRLPSRPECTPATEFLSVCSECAAWTLPIKSCLALDVIQDGLMGFISLSEDS